MLSCFGSLTGSMMTGPRIFFAMADRGLFFRGIARVSPRFQSPSVAIWLATALGVIYVLLNDFQQLADKFILGIWPFYALAVAAVFVLRRTRPDLPRPYRTWGYPVVPLLFLLASVAMVVNALVDRSGEHRHHVRDHPGGDSGVLRLAGVERADGRGVGGRVGPCGLVRQHRRFGRLPEHRRPLRRSPASSAGRTSVRHVGRSGLSRRHSPELVRHRARGASQRERQAALNSLRDPNHRSRLQRPA